MFININDIKIKDGRRNAAPENVQKLAESIQEVGMIHPITIGRDNTLIAGLHRLNAAKSLGWTAIDCNVTNLDGIQAEMAEIDENLVRTPLSVIETDNLLYRRKQLYEKLHPETKHGGVRQSGESKMTNCPVAPVKSFIEDTAEKLGVSSRTVSRSVQRAKNMTEDAKEIIQKSGVRVSRQNMDKLSRLEPEQQREAAEQLAAGMIQSVDEYQRIAPERKTAGNKKLSWNEVECGWIMDAYMGTMRETLRLSENFKERVEGFLKFLPGEDVVLLMKQADELRLSLEGFIALIKSDKVQNSLKEKENDNGNE